MSSTSERFGMTHSEMDRWERLGTSQSTRKQSERYRRRLAAERANRLAEWKRDGFHVGCGGLTRRDVVRG